MCRFWNLRSVLPLAALIGLAGCGVQPVTNAVHPNVAGVAGIVHGGQQPVEFSTVQLYTVGTTGDGSAATPLLTQTVMTDANGNFSFNFPNAYSCTGATLVYVTATGGDPIPGTANANLAMMAVLGPCSSLTSGTFITINELTTVAAVTALAPYMTGVNAVGSGSGDAAALAVAFGLANELVSSATGQTPGANVPAGMIVPTELIDTLADVVAACVNSGGGAAGSPGACGSLFTLTTPSGGAAPTNTVGALLDLANNPSLGTADLYDLALPGSPFQPQLAVAPADFRVRVTPAPLLLNPSSLSFSTTPLGGTTASQRVTLANTTASAVNLDGVGISGDFGQTNNCPASLAQGALCTVEVTFSPSAASARSGILAVTAGGGVTMIGLSGSGVASSTGPVTISPTTLTFYERQVAQPVTLTNYGSAPLGIGTIQFSSPNYTQENDCGSSLSGQSVCTIYVSAGATSGNFTGTMTLVDSDTTDAQVVSLATIAPYASVVDFHVTPLLQNSVGIDFYGGAYVSTSSGYDFYALTSNLSGPDQDWVGGSCTAKEFSVGNPAPIYYDACSSTVFMLPQTAGRLYDDFTSNMGDNDLFKGYGAGSSPEFFFSQPTIDFGGTVVGNTYTQNLLIENGSTTDITLTSVTPAFTVGASNNNEFSASISNCSGGGLVLHAVTVLPAAYTCNLTVTFTPTVLGPRATTLTVSSTGGLSHSIYVTGNGMYAAPVAPATVNLGNVQTGSTGTGSVTVTLPGLHPATAQIVEAGSPFAIAGPAYCAQGAAPCQFNLTFSPLALGAAQAHVVFTDTVSGLTATSILNGVGGVPVVSLSPTSLTFIPRTVGSQSIAQPVMLTNMGNAALVIASIGIGGTNSADYGQTNNCPATLNIGSSCTVNVTNTPTQVGPSSASVVIVSNAATSPDAVGLSGTGN